MATQTTRFDLPGYNLPLDCDPCNRSPRRLFPNALDVEDIEGGWADRIYVHREILMMQVIDTITDKPDWERKVQYLPPSFRIYVPWSMELTGFISQVFDDQIVAKWRDEIVASGQDITSKMMDWIFAELRWKADLYREKGHVVAYDTGVVKSDSAISLRLNRALRDAVRPLEEIPEEKKDYHPGSDNKVVDLVHPSLSPVIYGRSHILPDRLIGVDDCLNSIGQGQQLAVPEKVKDQPRDNDFRAYYPLQWSSQVVEPYSRKFQWMPCDVEFTEEQGCRIVSYINNLHPQKHRPLYGVIEKILEKVIPLWDATLTNVEYEGKHRIPYEVVDHLEHPDPEPQEPEDEDDNEAWDEYYERHGEWEDSTPIKLPEPGTFKPRQPDPKRTIDLRREFAEHGLQVIVKLANIELTPENPDYDGGSWHVEGQSNEHICATALYYYDSDNITENHLSFRQRAGRDNVQDVIYPQNQHSFIYEVFGFPRENNNDDDADVTQPLGSVSTREGRLLTFPNILQHRVSPFSLADKSKPGHRKILAFFLVDPHIRIISSANIPPQNEEWWGKMHEVMDKLLGSRLPAELREMVNENINSDPISIDEAKKYRLELMKERSSVTRVQNDRFESGSFNLCEH
ncbi:DUF4246 domain-containing protein [Aspergillus affinis]|uniref:DUF4246 domain-containing protein n=1 Tax=Aspergillus affinis TaxID=1070780 RepID=UPI0022FF25C3|nr:uncharacterized protein KD926_002716 [Aspergillus affinis]KAI9043826.1 hypothetical protein KD926_002716 [Aspergillus affinis]